jgi:hypothetical protein
MCATLVKLLAALLIKTLPFPHRLSMAFQFRLPVVPSHPVQQPSQPNRFAPNSIFLPTSSPWTSVCNSPFAFAHDRNSFRQISYPAFRFLRLSGSQSQHHSHAAFAGTNGKHAPDFRKDAKLNRDFENDRKNYNFPVPGYQYWAILFFYFFTV